MAEDKELYGYAEEDIMTLEYDDGEEEECGIIGVFEVEDIKGKEYIALNPLGSEEVYIYEYRDLGDDFDMLEIEDEDVAKRVIAAFEDIVEEE